MDFNAVYDSWILSLLLFSLDDAELKSCRICL